MNLFRIFILFLALAALFAQAPDSSSKMPASATPMKGLAKAAVSPNSKNEYVIKKPGEITFTTGIVIEGRVEKPQVMLIMSKEKIRLEPEVFQNSFLDKVTRPLQYNTFEFMGGEGK